jgi:hypothetical protein
VEKLAHDVNKEKRMGEAHRQRTSIGTDIPNSQYKDLEVDPLL